MDKLENKQLDLSILDSLSPEEKTLALSPYGYIYLTTNMITNKKYIGKHKAKVFEPDNYLGSGKRLKTAFQKYGKENFKCELLQWCFSPEELNNQEINWIKKFNACSDINFYNIAAGGEGGEVYAFLSSDQKLARNKKISESLLYTFDTVSPDYYQKRADKKRQTLSLLSADEKKRRHEINSQAQLQYNATISEEAKLKRNLAHKKTIAQRTPEQEAIRKQKEKITKNNWSVEFKEAYFEKLSAANKGKKKYTDGITVISCYPGTEPKGFYLGGANKNKYKFVYYYEGLVFNGKTELISYLKAQNYNIIISNVDSIIAGTAQARKKFPALIGKIKKENRQ